LPPADELELELDENEDEVEDDKDDEEEEDEVVWPFELESKKYAATPATTIITMIATAATTALIARVPLRGKSRKLRQYSTWSII